MNFTDETILKMFGNEAAESESAGALRAYYFKNEIYEQVHSDLPLRILVGHKGTGKSALFRVAEMEDEERGVLSVFLRPDDIAGIGLGNEDILQLIREWKRGLRDVIYAKVLLKFNIHQDKWKQIALAGGLVLDTIAEVLRKCKGEVQLDAIREKILDKYLENNKVSIYIDDLDRGWEARKADIRRISALLNAARDMSADSPGLHFKISLRSDVYYLVRTSDESTDKIEGSVVWCKWTQHEILALLVKRLKNYLGQKVSDEQLVEMDQGTLASALNDFMEKTFFGRGKWSSIPMHRMLLSLIRRRPRDLIKLCTMGAREAARTKATKIETQHFDCILEAYSQERLQDAVNEFKSELPSIEDLLLNMRPSRRQREQGILFLYSPDELTSKLKEILSRKRYLFSNGKNADAKDLTAFLYKINFIHARKELTDGTIDRKLFEDNRYVANRGIDFGYSWEIHAAYRWALLPEGGDEIYRIGV